MPICLNHPHFLCVLLESACRVVEISTRKAHPQRLLYIPLVTRRVAQGSVLAKGGNTIYERDWFDRVA